MPVVTAIVAIALLVLLAGMEGLEVAVIDRWRSLYPQRTTSDLAAWLAARQLFVTTATLLAHRDAIIVPGTGNRGHPGHCPGPVRPDVDRVHGVVVRADLPEASGGDDPDRYLGHLRNMLFPIVEVVRRVGVSQPGEWVAAGVERRLDWPVPYVEEAPFGRKESLGSIWRELIPEQAPAAGPPAREMTDAGPAAAQEPEKTKAE